MECVIEATETSESSQALLDELLSPSLTHPLHPPAATRERNSQVKRAFNSLKPKFPIPRLSRASRSIRNESTAVSLRINSKDVSSAPYREKFQIVDITRSSLSDKQELGQSKLSIEEKFRKLANKPNEDNHIEECERKEKAIVRDEVLLHSNTATSSSHSLSIAASPESPLVAPASFQSNVSDSFDILIDSPDIYAIEKGFFVGKLKEMPPPLYLNEEWVTSIRIRLIKDLLPITQALPPSLSRKQCIFEPELCMAGEADRQSKNIIMRPTVWIRCGSKKCRKAIQQAVDDLEYIQTFSRGRVQVKLCAPRPAADSEQSALYKAPENQDLILQLQCDYRTSDIHGRRLRIINAMQGTETVWTSTIGGIIRVDENIYGLTTAHSIFEARRFAFGNSDDESTESESESDSSTERGMCLVNPECSDTIFAEDSGSNENDGQEEENVQYENVNLMLTGYTGQGLDSDGKDPATDFALIQFPNSTWDDGMLPVYNTYRSPRNGTFNLTLFDESPEEGEVDILSHPTEVCTGWLLPGTSLFVQKDGYFPTRKIQMTRPLHPGSSGSWVVRGHRLLGQIIAVYDDEPYAHMMPISDVVHGIREAFEAMNPPEISLQIRTISSSSANHRENVTLSRPQGARLADRVPFDHQWQEEDDAQTESGFTDLPTSSGPKTDTYSGTTAHDPPPRYKIDRRDVASDGHCGRALSPPFRTDPTLRSMGHALVGRTAERLSSPDRSAYSAVDFRPERCPSSQSSLGDFRHWLSISTIVISIFSTSLSAAYFIIAITAPRYGRRIHSQSSTTPSTMVVLTQVFAQLIALSFVEVFATVIGQILSRRAVSRASRGVSLSEMSMRTWPALPLTIITRYKSGRYAALTFLGIFSLVVAVLAMTYSTAASAVVAPVLGFGPWEHRLLYGVVETSFANLDYLTDNCQMPTKAVSWTTRDFTEQLSGPLCLSLGIATQGLSNLQQYIGTWSEFIQSGNGMDDQRYRPQGTGMLLTNTTIQGSWIHIIDTKAISQKYSRVVNNVTLAMPHVGVFKAARDPKSDILQPVGLDGVGVYKIRAALPSPYINVLCANVQANEIKGLVYAALNGTALNPAVDLPTHYSDKFDWSYLSTLQTPLDDVFEWGPQNAPPVFYKYPMPLNTILSDTQRSWGRDSIYLLGNSAAEYNTTRHNEYLLCRAKAGLTPNCSTIYNATAGGGQMTARCEDPSDDMAYIKGNSSRIETTSLGWLDIAQAAFRSLSLDDGLTDGNASIARRFTELMLQKGELNPFLPSAAEVLAVMIGSTLAMSAQDSPFVEFWNYSSPAPVRAYQAFNASFQIQEYASGGSTGFRHVFIIILFAVFIINALFLLYLSVYKALLTDFVEPSNLFSLAINSPPSKHMYGSCGGGPEGRQYALRWGIEMEHEHLFLSEKDHKSHSVYGLRGNLRSRSTELSTSWSELFTRRGKWIKIPSEDENIEMGLSTSYEHANRRGGD